MIHLTAGVVTPQTFKVPIRNGQAPYTCNIYLDSDSPTSLALTYVAKSNYFEFNVTYNFTRDRVYAIEIFDSLGKIVFTGLIDTWSPTEKILQNEYITI